MVVIAGLAWIQASQAAFATDVSSYFVRRGLEHLQTGPGLPAVNITNGYGFAAEVDLSGNSSVTNASVRPPLSLPAQALTLSSSQSKWDYSRKYDSLADLNAHYPPGTYTFTIQGRNDGLKRLSLPLAGGAFPGGPHIRNFAAAQAVHPSGYLEILWDSFAGGTAGDFIQLRVEDALGNKLFETPDRGQPGAYDGTATRVLVEPGFLAPGQTNKATLIFQKTLVTDRTNYPGATGFAALYARTTFPLITTRAARPEVKTLEVYKTRRLIQTNSSLLLPQAGREFTLEASVRAYTNGVLTTGALLFPPTNSAQPLLKQLDGITLDFSGYALTQSALDAAYPNGTYTLVFPTLNDGNRSVALQLTNAAFPPVPRFSNFDAFRTVDVSQPFTVTWDPWLGGGLCDFIQLRVEDTLGTKLFETPDPGEQNALNGRATNATIPAAALPAGQTLSLRLNFLQLSQVDTTTYPGVLSLAGVQTRTRAALTTFAGAEVMQYSVTKGRLFQQVDAGAPAVAAANSFTFDSLVVGLSTGSVISAWVTTPAGTGSSLVGQAGGKQYSLTDAFADPGALDAAYPNGAFSLQISTAHHGLKTLPLSLTADRYPNAPQVTNFNAAQLIDSRNDFSVKWAPFVQGTAMDFIQLSVTDAAGSLVYQTPDYRMAKALDGLATAARIPAGRLGSNQVYSARLVFKRMVALDSTTYPGARGFAAYASATRFPIRTRGAAPTGLLQVHLAPGVAGMMGAQWQVDGGAWHKGGITLYGMSTGAHTVAFSRVSGWTSPANQTVIVRANQTTALTRAYLAQNCTVTLSAAPDAGGWVTGGGTFAAGFRTVTAIPAPGYVFRDWTGSVEAATPALKFALQSNVVLQANFVPNPFLPVKGSYAGLFADPAGVTHTNAGLFAATLADKGSFSARLQLAGKTYPFSARFSYDGSCSNAIPRFGLPPLSIRLQLDLSGSPGRITGQVSDGTWTAELLAQRAAYSKASPAPQAGRKFTLAIAGADDASVQPGGCGYGTLSVSALGTLSFIGVLGDGTPVAQGSFVAGPGHWPLYLSLYSGKGVLAGWLTFTNGVDRDVTGQVSWMKAPQASRLYPNGFGGAPLREVVGSVYAFTNQVPLLSFSQGQVLLQGGNLWQSSTNQILLATNRLINLGPSNQLAITITAGSGLFRGSVLRPVTGQPVAFSGVLLQKANSGAGYFLGTNQSGSVYLGPE